MAGITSYTRSILLSAKAALRKDQNRVPASVFQRLRQLDICAVRPTKRGTRGYGKLMIPAMCKGLVAARSRSPPGAESNVNNLRCITTARVHDVNKPRCQGRTLLSLLNARSACNKEAVLRDCITENQLDMLAITETWLNPTSEKRVCAGLLPEGYDIMSVSRQRGRGGGVALIYRTTLKCSRCSPQSKTKSFECLEVTVSTSSASLKLVIVYRPPPSSKNGLTQSDFYKEFADYMTSLQSSPANLLVIGDFNVHWENTHNSETANFHDLLETTNSTQHVNGPTHIEGHTIDLVISRSGDKVIHSVQVGPLISDHHIIQCSLNLTKPPLPKKTLSCRKLRAVDHTAVDDDIKQSELVSYHESAPGDLHNLYTRSLLNILDKHAPEKTVTVTIRPNTSWITDDILHEKRLRRKCERKWRSTGLEIHRQIFTNQRDKVNKLIQASKVSHYQAKIAQCGNDQKALFGVVKSLLNRARTSTDSTGILDADDFNQFFINKISKIYDLLGECGDEHDTSELPSPHHMLQNFVAVTIKDVVSVIAKSPTKSSTLDPWPTWMLKAHMDKLAPLVTTIVNHSLSIGLFPYEWKHALVTPILKKPSLDPCVLSHYRPISNLPFLSKVLERVVAKQLTGYLHSNKLYPTFQSAYRPNHSVETALLRVHNDIMQAIDNQQGVVMVLLDTSAAFDTIPHDMLLHRLQHRFGITGTVLKWITSYLTGRSQSVVYGGKTSKPLPVPHGVPQGSVLGPILFSMFTSPISDIVSQHNIKFHLYADDTQIYLTFNFRENHSIHNTMNLLQLCIAGVMSWMTKNKLKINGDKTEMMILSSPKLRTRVELSVLEIGDTTISASPTIRNLGSWFDQAATMVDHVKFVCRTGFYHLHNIARIRNILTRDATEKLIHAFITSRLDNCNSLLVNVPSSIIKQLQRVQNAAARVVVRKTKRDSISEILHQLHWLPVQQRIIFKVLCVTFKCFHGSAPTYLSDLVQPYVPSRSLRSTNQHLLCQPSSHTRTYGERSFSVAAPKLWNDLPLSIRVCNEYTTFKNLVKTHLFRNAFPDF